LCQGGNAVGKKMKGYAHKRAKGERRTVRGNQGEGMPEDRL